MTVSLNAAKMPGLSHW